MSRVRRGQRIVFFGDSITRGFFGSSYVNALKRLMADRAVGEGIELINAGRDGDMIDDLLLRVEHDVIERKPDWAIVLIGINDVFYDAVMLSGLSPQHPARGASLYEHLVVPFTENYGTLVDTLADAGLRVAVCTTTGVEGGVGIEVRDKLALLNDAIRTLSETKKLDLIDVHDAFAEHLDPASGAGRTGYHLTVDGVHLSKEGARLVAERIFKFLFE